MTSSDNEVEICATEVFQPTHFGNREHARRPNHAPRIEEQQGIRFRYRTLLSSLFPLSPRVFRAPRLPKRKPAPPSPVFHRFSFSRVSWGFLFLEARKKEREIRTVSFESPQFPDLARKVFHRGAIASLSIAARHRQEENLVCQYLRGRLSQEITERKNVAVLG